MALTSGAQARPVKGHKASPVPTGYRRKSIAKEQNSRLRHELAEAGEQLGLRWQGRGGVPVATAAVLNAGDGAGACSGYLV